MAEPTPHAEGQRLYLMARKDLPSSMRTVQTAHACSTLAWKLRDSLPAEHWGEFGPFFVCYQVPDAESLEGWAEKLGEEAVLYREPDLGHEATALAYYGPRHKGFSHLRLL